MRRIIRPLAFSFLSVTTLAACSGQLYLNAEDALTDFDPADRDGGGGDPIDNGDGNDNGDGTNTGDVDGDSLLGDGFGGDGGDQDCPECCGFGGACDVGFECFVGVCVPACPTAKCGELQLCCRAPTTECCDKAVDASCGEDHCRTPCPVNNVHCGDQDQLCCDTTTGGDGGRGLACGPDLQCVTACGATDGPLCISPSGSAAGVCCDGRNPADHLDDDVCLYGTCVERGDSCQSFLDCPNGYYCELLLDDSAHPDDDLWGVCLPNDFPDGTAQCQSPPDDLFSPITEWSWVGVQVIGGTGPTDTNLNDDFVIGDVIPRCTTAGQTKCFREPCTDYFNFYTCFRSVESVPTTADIDQADDGSGKHPEVVFKPYSDNSFNANFALIAIADGRADADLPDPNGAIPTNIPSKTQRTKALIFGGTRGHLGLADLDIGTPGHDTDLEIVETHGPGVCVFDPYVGGVLNTTHNGTPGQNAMKWCSSVGPAPTASSNVALNTNFTGGAPVLTDFNNDGIPEVVLAGVVLRAASTGGGNGGDVLLDINVLEPSGSVFQAGESNSAYDGNGVKNRCVPGVDCFNVTTVADVDVDGKAEILSGNEAWEVSVSGGTYSATLKWFAHHDDNPTVHDPLLGPGFPGVADFTNDPKGSVKPEVAIVYGGRVYIVDGTTGAVLRSTVTAVDNHYCATDAVCRDQGTKNTCNGVSQCGWNNGGTNQSGCAYNPGYCQNVTDQGTCQGRPECNWNNGRTPKCDVTTVPTCPSTADTTVTSCHAASTPNLCVWNGACNENGTCAGLTTSTNCEAQTGCSWDVRELNFPVLQNRGGPPNIADFDGDGHDEVSFAGTGCMVVIDPDCAAGDAAGRDTLTSTPGSGCSVARAVQPCAGHGNQTTCQADVANGCTWNGSLCRSCAGHLTQPSCEADTANGCTWTTSSVGPQCATHSICNVEADANLTNQIGLLWMYQTQDQSSAVTGTSVFDFQGDGKAEVLYNDECFFRVFEGFDRKVLYERPNSHRTATEYPIVVDVDGDSNSEIVVVSTGDQAVIRDRCGGPAVGQTLSCSITDKGNCLAAGCAWNDTSSVCSTTTCASRGTQSACANIGGCGWTGAACNTCSQFGSAATCDPVKNAPPTCGSRATSGACVDGGGGCGWTGSACAVCSSLNQTQCGANTTSGCAWDGAACYATCNAVRDGSDGGNGIDTECNASPGCFYDTTGTAGCYRKLNGCNWTGSACVPDCSLVADANDGAGDITNECNALPGCQQLLNTCKPKSYRRNEWTEYVPAACTCNDHPVQADCNAARGCAWNGSSCAVVAAATCNGFTQAQCLTHGDDCLWDPFQGGSGTCETHPRSQDYICNYGTWGVTAFGDSAPKPQWVRTLPYWEQHSFHITEEDKNGDILADWTPRDANYAFYNNFRQNVPGFVPLNAPDLVIVLPVVSDRRECPPKEHIIVTIANKGRAGIRHGTPVGFYRMTTSETFQQTAARTDAFAMVQVPVDLLPGQTTTVDATYVIGNTEPPINMDFRIIVDPPFVVNQDTGAFECNANNNVAELLNVDCVDTGS